MIITPPLYYTSGWEMNIIILALYSWSVLQPYRQIESGQKSDMGMFENLVSKQNNVQIPDCD